MIIASCRKNFDSTLFIADLAVHSGGKGGPAIDLCALGLELAGKPVAILVHGYHTDYQNAVSAYATIEHNAIAHGMGYTFIGFLWPGSPVALGFFPAIKRATESGKYLFDLIYELRKNNCDVTVETHSLGARVALEALKLGASVERLILTAPAVDDGVLGEGGEFCPALPAAQKIAVMFSANDPVLGREYWWAELLLEHRRVHALGLDGPEAPRPSKVQAFDMSDQIHGHSEYKDCQQTYIQWKAFA